MNDNFDDVDFLVIVIVSLVDSKKRYGGMEQLNLARLFKPNQPSIVLTWKSHVFMLPIDLSTPNAPICPH
jgi:hypothetical protein